MYKSVRSSFVCSRHENHFKFSPRSGISEGSTCARFEGAATPLLSFLNKLYGCRNHGLYKNLCWFQPPAFDIDLSEPPRTQCKVVHRDNHWLKYNTPRSPTSLTPDIFCPYLGAFVFRSIAESAAIDGEKDCVFF